MKVYISADIEGVAGIAGWNEAKKGDQDYIIFQEQMTREVAAACEGAIRGGASSVVVKDAHWTGMNILHEKLPEQVQLIRGWSGHPYCMVQELDSSFDALMYVGYHSRAAHDGNPLAHTLSSSKVSRIIINDQPASEFLIHSYVAAMHRVPVVLLTGDEAICAEAKLLVKHIKTVSSMRGVGASVISDHPKTVRAKIREAAEQALMDTHLEACKVRLPDSFAVQINFRAHQDAYKGGFYPGAERIDAHTVGFHSANFFDVLTMLKFLI